MAYRQAQRGTDQEELNQEGVTLDHIARKRKLEREQSSKDAGQATVDEDDDI